MAEQSVFERFREEWGLPQDFVPYQDIWIKGRALCRGQRRCARRYKMIHDALSSRYRPGFSVLDIGASEGYFSIRLAEDLKAQCLLLEKKSSLDAIVRAQENPNLSVIQGSFSHDDILSRNQDVVIALSIAHHFENWGQFIRSVLQVADTAIIELPASKEASTKRAQAAHRMKELLAWYSPSLLGVSRGYGKEATRELYVLDYPTRPKKDTVVMGKVTGGRSSSARQKRHYLSGLRDATGIHVEPGTLNLRMTSERHFKGGFSVGSEKGDYHFFPCRFEGLRAFVVKPPRAKNRPNTLEIMSDIPLRKVFGLEDGESVAVELDPETLTEDVTQIRYPIRSLAEPLPA